MAELIIGARYNGPPGSGNGGYCAGSFAHASGLSRDALEVTLRRPPPLEVALQTREAEEGIDVFEGQDLVAQVRPSAIDAEEIVDSVNWDEAVAASASYPGFATHPFPTCFVCGPQRAEGDGLRLFPGRLPDGRTATPFRVPEEVSPPSGRAKPRVGAELVWASLDCPGGWAVPLEGRPYVLGRLAVRIWQSPVAGDECVVMGAITGEDGRKAYVRTTLWSAQGDVLATARATWLALA
jgi:hypothetical protein